MPTTIVIEQNIEKNCEKILADPTHIHQIALNLITNAYHAMEELGGTLQIELKNIDIVDQADIPYNMNPGKYVLLSVADTGGGMDEETAEKIFIPYFTTKPQGKGTGLGLSVVHGIVKSYNGEIQVTSKHGEGTAFDIYFPAYQHAIMSKTVDEKDSVEMGNERILLVDDDEQIVRLEKQMLERLGYQVSTRTSSIEALEAFKAGPYRYDVVITDMTMPNLTGDMLARSLMEIRKDIPVILCTGFSERITQEKAEALGIKGFLMKPVIKSEMAKEVRKVLIKTLNKSVIQAQ